MDPALPISNLVTAGVITLSAAAMGERITIHNYLRDQLHDLSASAALNPTKDSRFLLPGRDRRPADVFIPSWA